MAFAYTPPAFLGCFFHRVHFTWILLEEKTVDIFSDITVLFVLKPRMYSSSWNVLDWNGTFFSFTFQTSLIYLIYKLWTQSKVELACQEWWYDDLIPSVQSKWKQSVRVHFVLLSQNIWDVVTYEEVNFAHSFGGWKVKRHDASAYSDSPLLSLIMVGWALWVWGISWWDRKPESGSCPFIPTHFWGLTRIPKERP
jgi:hypothetical protein